jgi:hypothetical protein
MKTENAKPRRARMNYKVSELHHLFFNQALPEGAKAGEMAAYSNGTLWHDKGKPAAAFLIDARGPGDIPAALILPDCEGARWSSNELMKAAPEGVKAVVLKAWPGERTCWSDNARAICANNRFRSAAGMLQALTAAVDYDCSRAAHSARDAAGNDPVNVPRYVAAARELLSLDWNDAGARESARAALQAVLDVWQLSDAGEYNLKAVQAVSMRKHREKEAAPALVKVRDYFTARAAAAAVKTPAGFKARLAAANDARRLGDSIAAVLAADIPAALLAGLPVNLSGAIAADAAWLDRVNARAEDWNAARDMWAGNGRTYHGRHFTAAGARADYDAALKYQRAKGRRADVRSKLQTAAGCLEHLNELAGLLPDLLAGIESGAPDYGRMDVVNRGRAASTCAGIVASYNDEFCKGKNPALVYPAGLPAAADLDAMAGRIKGELAAYEEREKYNLQASRIRADIARALALATTTPRKALAGMGLVYGWQWQNAPEELRATVKAEHDAAAATLRAACENVSEIEEYENGGAAPGYGDWLLIKGREAITTRGARVPARAIEKAFLFIDSQPAGAFDCRAAGFKIGDYQLNGRDDNGAVIVGCHTFSAASVEHIRAQLAAAATSRQESENAA